MTYNLEEIATRVGVKRKSLIIKATVISSVMVVLLVIALINLGNTVTFLCSLTEFPLIGILCAVMKKSHARVIFSPEIVGKNIKEHEYGIQRDASIQVFRRGNMPHTYANRKPHPVRLNGTVFLETQNGNVTQISGLYKSHIDIYEEGDILMKPRGAKFPIVISRDAPKQPCPMCGEVNDGSEDSCRVCGLGIIKSQ